MILETMALKDKIRQDNNVNLEQSGQNQGRQKREQLWEAYINKWLA